jgi:ketosteroid isomerase-like protein
MTHLYKLVLIILLLSCGSRGTQDLPIQKDDKKLIEEMLSERFNEFQNSTDPNLKAQIYVKDVDNDAVWMPPNSKLIRGKEEIRNWGEWFFSNYKLVLDPKEQYFEEPVIDGNVAYRRFTSGGYYIVISSGDSVRFHQKYIDTFKKINGSWKITTHMWSSDNLDVSIWNYKFNSN